MQSSANQANHQGIFFDDRFNYYSPMLTVRRDAKTPPELITLLDEQMKNSNSVSYRLDATLSIERDNYKPFYREFAEVCHGREINLDDIQFPLHQGKNEYFCVFNPETM
ncbi:hypothetical protein [Cytobacillus depressus]|uniref:hypothetical protein n=1 Tax=Cytobacillus depressus TaxID=1602942 RepID=UPI00124EDA15|nr:hypothetical protein [Cytobacillus depressus]